MDKINRWVKPHKVSIPSRYGGWCKSSDVKVLESKLEEAVELLRFSRQAIDGASLFPGMQDTEKLYQMVCKIDGFLRSIK